MIIADVAKVYPLLALAEHSMAPRYYSIAHEYPFTVKKAKAILRNATLHISYQPHADNNWSRVLPHLRKD